MDDTISVGREIFSPIQIFWENLFQCYICPRCQYFCHWGLVGLKSNTFNTLGKNDFSFLSISFGCACCSVDCANTSENLIHTRNVNIKVQSVFKLISFSYKSWCFCYVLSRCNLDVTRACDSQCHLSPTPSHQRTSPVILKSFSCWSLGKPITFSPSLRSYYKKETVSFYFQYFWTKLENFMSWRKTAW